MHVNLTIEGSSGDRTDIRVSTEQPVRWAELRKLLLSELAEDASRSTILSEEGDISDQSLLGDRGLRDGQVLTVVPAGTRTVAARSALLLRVTAGPDCGHVVPLSRGTYQIGRDPKAAVSLADPDLSRRHLCLRVTSEYVAVADLGSTNGTVVNSEPLGATDHQIRPGDIIKAGNSTLELISASEPPALTKAVGDGHCLVHRPPRLTQAFSPVILDLPDQQHQSARPRIQWLAAIIPLVLSVGLAVTLHSTQLLAFAALSPLSMVVTAIADRRSWRHGRAAAQRCQQREESQVRAEAQLQLRAEESYRHRVFADAASVLQASAVPTCRLWERRTGDQEFLRLRVGTADQDSQTQFRRGSTVSAAGTLTSVPATISLRRRVLGVAGPRPHSAGLARWLVAQLLVLHSPTDVSLIVLTDEDRSADWRWLRWASDSLAAVATRRHQHIEAVDQLVKVVRERSATAAASSRDWTGHWQVLVIDPASLTADLPGLGYLLEYGCAVGVSAICVSEDERLLPTFCGASAVFHSATGVQVRLRCAGQNALDVSADRVRLDWAERVARQLAPLKDAEDRRAGGIPDRVRLSELLGFSTIEEEQLHAMWARPNRHPATPIGTSAAGTFVLDLIRDGPHLLIAGTTGSGKSELLRALVAGLAVQLPPEEISFVLIDYKGGAAFAECADFPHVLGMVTDLDAHLTRRALLSLNAELQRREAAFARASVSSLAEYRASAENTVQPLGRLVLVIDEFASLAEELPQFLDGLLGIAQRGRSLGVHLVLATQRPAGVLSQDIKANMSLRIALRVTDASESVDVIGSDAAHKLDRRTPGRAIARSGEGELTEFQTARVAVRVAQRQQLTCSELDEWNSVAQEEDFDADTDLIQLQRAALRLAVHRQCPSRPWLEPLPSRLVLDVRTGSHLVEYGIRDDPQHQTQDMLSHDLWSGGAIGFIGGPRSGRTSALRTFVGLACGQLSADDLHVYAIDCAGPNLHQLMELTHCGAVVDVREPAAIVRLIRRLTEERQRRQREIAELGATNFSEARQLGSRLPAVIVVLDGWEMFSELSDSYDAGSCANAFVQLMRTSASAGLTYLVSGDRAALGLRIGSAFGTKLVLPMTDPADYSLAGILPAAVPTTALPGRALSAGDDLEVQLACLSEADSTSREWQRLRELAIPDSPTAGPAIAIKALPDQVSLHELRAQAQDRDATSSCLLGLGGDDAAPVASELFTPFARFLVTGPPRSGKSNAAALIATQASEIGLRVVIAAPERSPLTAWARTRCVDVVHPATEFEIPDGDLLLIDDAEQFTSDQLQSALLERICRADIAVVATARVDDVHVSFRGIAVEMKRHRVGLLLQPSPVDGEILGVRIDRRPFTGPPGRGFLVSGAPETRGEPLEIQLAQADR